MLHLLMLVFLFLSLFTFSVCRYAILTEKGDVTYTLSGFDIVPMTNMAHVFWGLSSWSSRFSNVSSAWNHELFVVDHQCVFGYVTPGSPWPKLRGRRILSTRERTSFVAIPQTENGRVLSWRADNLPSFSSRFAMYIRRLKSLFTALFTIWRAVDRPLYRCVYRGDRTCGCGDTTF